MKLDNDLEDGSRAGSRFREDFKLDVDSRNSSIVSRDPEVIQRHRLFMEAHFDAHDTTWEPATIISMHPRPLTHNFGYMGHLTVPKRPENQAYSRFCVRDYRLDSRDLGGAKYVPLRVNPLQLAKDFCKQFEEMGGVFCYIGDRAPKKEEMEAAFEKMLVWYRKIFRAAQDQWSRKQQRAFIDDHMRSAARVMREMGELDRLPEWVDETRTEARAKKLTCLQCGQDSKPAAKICIHCRFVFDEAFYTERGFVVSGGIIISSPGGAAPAAPIQTIAPPQVQLTSDASDEKDDFDFKSDEGFDPAKQSGDPLKEK